MKRDSESARPEPRWISMIRKFTATGKAYVKMDSGSGLMVVVGMVVRAAFAVVAWNVDSDAFAGMGRYVYYYPGAALGVYTVPAYFMAGFYAIWNALPMSHSVTSYDFAMKVPSLIFDFLTALLIYRILSQTNVSKSRVRWVLGAWLLNPLTLLAGGYNSMEVVPAFLLLLSSYLAAQKKLVSASVALIAGGLLRFVPFMSLPFLLAIVIRARDWKGAIRITLVAGGTVATVLAWMFLSPGLFDSLASGGAGLLRPEVYDGLGVKLSTNIVPYPASTVALTALAYMLMLCAVLFFPRRQSGVIAAELSLPIYAYLAFSFAAPPPLMYVIPFALIQMANFKAYKIPIAFFSVLGCLRSVVRVPDYFFYLPSASNLFYVHCHAQYWDFCSLALPLNNGAWWLQTNLQPQITGAFAAVLLFIAAMSTSQGGLQRFLQSLGGTESRSSPSLSNLPRPRPGP